MLCMHQAATPDEITVRPVAYNACMDVFDSDHKPVWASLAVDIPITHHDKCRRLASHVLKAAASKSTPPVPLLKLSTNVISLHQVRFAGKACAVHGRGRGEDVRSSSS